MIYVIKIQEVKILYLTHKQRLYPTEYQKQKFIQFAGTSRWAYNECLSYKIKCYKEDNYVCKIQDMIKHIQELKYSDEYKWVQETPEAATRILKCPQCNTIIDRDLNAAINLKNYALAY